MGAAEIVRMRGIAKRFGPVDALRSVDFSLVPGECHALLGENGAGKSTLMRVLFGLIKADAGVIEVDGAALPPARPQAAMAAGLGMVHQHFSQDPRMSVAENVWLGRAGVRYDAAAAAATVRRVGEASGLTLDPGARAGDLPAGMRQRLEIVKALARDVRVLILDEPTASLTPHEVDELFGALKRLTARGIAVALITHKLREVERVADRVTVLRRGRVALTAPAAECSRAALTEAVVGADAAPYGVGDVLEERVRAAPRPRAAVPALEVRDLTVLRSRGAPPSVRGVSLEVAAGEIVGIAAVEGNGQRELMRAVAGLMPYRGSVQLGPGEGVGFVPEDRQEEGLILEFTVLENLALGARHRFWLSRRFLEHQATVAIDEYGMTGARADRAVATLSGGNQQKVVLARELGRTPALLVAENPTRGLDVRATADVHERLRRAADRRGLGVLFYSTDLDEVLTVADRIGVMVAGSWQWVSEAQRTREAVGALMLGLAA